MKQLIVPAKLLIIIELLLVSTVKSFAESVYVYINEFEYIINTDSITAKAYGTKSFNAKIENIVIPDYIEYKGTQYPVTSVGGFTGHSGITGSLIIGNNVTIIEDHAFLGCKFNGSLTIGNSVTTIGGNTFQGFTGSLIIPSSVNYIGEGAFNRCNFTGTLEIGSNVTHIGYEAFGHFWTNNKFTGTLTIPNSVITIGDRAFYKCGFNEELIIGNSLTDIGKEAFEYCNFIGSLTIPNSVKKIGKSAFSECTGFTGPLRIGNSVTDIGERAFYGCSGFTGALRIPDSVTTIGGGAFNGCSGFTGALNIPKNIIDIEGTTFCGCSGFTGALIIPEYITSIGSCAFMDCDQISSIEIKSQNIEINYGAFCIKGLKSVTCFANTPPPCIYSSTTYLYAHDCVFEESKTYYTPLYVPAQSVDSYKTAQEWKKFKYINPIKVKATSITLDKSKCEALVGDSFSLTATITPEDAEQEVKWETSNPEVATVSSDGKVEIIGEGYAIITASTTDDSKLSATCDITAWLRGDSNGDTMVNVADVVNSVNYIVGNPMNKFVFIATDLNDDKDISVTDATLIAQLILNTEITSDAKRKLLSLRSSKIGSNDFVNASQIGNKFILSMGNSGYTAFQADISLPEGAELEDIRLVDDAKITHTLMTSKNGNTVRVIAFALSNEELITNKPFMELTLKGNNINDMITVEQAIASDAQAIPTPISVRLNGPTSGISSPEDLSDIKIEAGSQGVIIHGGENNQVNIHNIVGSLIHSGKCLSNTQFISLTKGIYIISIGKRTFKIEI